MCRVATTIGPRRQSTTCAADAAKTKRSSVWRHAWRKSATGAAPRSTPAKPPKMPPFSTHAPACWSSIRHWSTSRNTTSRWLKNEGNGPAGANTVACIIIAVLSYLYIRARRRHRRLMQQTSAMRKQLSDMRTAVADKNDNAMHFLQLALESVLKFEQIKQLVQIKLESGENERLKKMMKDPALLDNFKEKCLRRFDVAFLRLYPSFIKEVNALLREDAQLVLSETEFMNNDLRLLAFLRIGITDSAQIAAILGVSVNTVYCYRTKLRNRAIDRNNFEKQIAEKDA